MSTYVTNLGVKMFPRTKLGGCSNDWNRATKHMSKSLNSHLSSQSYEFWSFRSTAIEVSYAYYQGVLRVSQLGTSNGILNVHLGRIHQ